MGVLRSLLPFLLGIPLLLLCQWQLDVAHMDLVTLVAVNVGVNIVLAVSLNVVNGFTGQFSLGHAGFMAVGAYTAAKLTLAYGATPLFGLPLAASAQLVFFLALVAGMLASGLAG